MKRNTSPRHSPTSALRPALELLEQRLVMDHGLGDILSSQPAVIELTTSVDWSPSLDAFSSDLSPRADHDWFASTDEEADEAQAKDAADLATTTDDTFLNFEQIIGPFPDANDMLSSDGTTAPQPPGNQPDEFHLNLGLPDHDMQNKYTLSPVEPADVSYVDPDIETGLSKVRGWSPLEAPVVIQMPAPPAGLMAAELPTRLPDSLINQPLITHNALPVVAATSISMDSPNSGVLKQSSTPSLETDIEMRSPKFKAVVEEQQTPASEGLAGISLAIPAPWISPSAAIQLSPEIYFTPHASPQRAPMAWTNDNAASATRKHAVLESSEIVLLTEAADTSKPAPSNLSKLADDENLVDSTLDYFSDLATNALAATRLASGVLIQGISNKQIPRSNDSEVLPAVIADFLPEELAPHAAAIQQGSLPADPTATSWSEVLVLIVAGLLLPAYMQEPRVRNV